LPDQTLLTTARRPSREQATPAGLRPQGCSARTLPAVRSTRDAESEVWLAVSASRPPGRTATSIGLRCGSGAAAVAPFGGAAQAPRERDEGQQEPELLHANSSEGPSGGHDGMAAGNGRLKDSLTDRAAMASSWFTATRRSWTSADFPSRPGGTARPDLYNTSQ